MIDPKDLIGRLSVEQLGKTAEDYFASITDPTYLHQKPFHSLHEGADLLRNVGELFAGLRLAPSMSVLEFGAGSCWLSRWLAQARCETISCDVSPTALRLGRELFERHPIVGEPIAPPRFLLFDGRRIDLPDASVDRVVCNDAFHHVPNPEQVLAELCRILKPGGIAGFSEPGRFHSQTRQSQLEMSNFTVLENDVIVEDIFAMALRGGFTDIKLRLLSRSDLTLEQYQRLTLRSVDLDFAKQIVDGIGDVMTAQTIFFLHKGEPTLDSRSETGLQHRIECIAPIAPVRAGQPARIRLAITNCGKADWLVRNHRDIGVVRIGVQRLDAEGRMVEPDFARHAIATPVPPGERFEQAIDVVIDQPGEHRLRIDLVAEGVSWFGPRGSAPLETTLRVTPA